jgi:hypothetical protein
MLLKYFLGPLLEGGGDGGGGGDGLPDKEKDPQGYWRAYYKREADKAFETRDTAKAEIAKLLGKDAKDLSWSDAIKEFQVFRPLNEEQKKEFERLKTVQTKAEEERRRREGEFDTWKGEISTQHKQELDAVRNETATERKAREALETEIAGEKIFTAFASATEFFGTDKSKTVLSAHTAFRAMREFCSYEQVEVGGVKKKMIVVRKPDGSRILGEDGNPAPFAEAVGKLIAALPDKDQILRGSQRAGSGGSGGSNYEPGDLDLDHLTDEQLRDPKVRRALRDRSANAGGIVMGRAFLGDRTGAQK